MPNKTLVSSREKEAKGFKLPKDRVTIIPCANATKKKKFTSHSIQAALKMLPKVIFQSTIMPKRAPGRIPPFSQLGSTKILCRDAKKLLERKVSPNEPFSFWTMLPPILILNLCAQVMEKYLASTFLLILLLFNPTN